MRVFKRRLNQAAVAVVAAVIFLSCGNGAVKASFLYVDSLSFVNLFSIDESGYNRADGDVLSTLTAEINTTLQEFEQQIAVSSASSDTYRVNSAAAGGKIYVGRYFKELFKLSKNLHAQTDGYFNIATYNLTKLWGFAPENEGYYSVPRAEPSAESIAAAAELADIDFLVFDSSGGTYEGQKKYIALYDTDTPYIIKSDGGIAVDFGGIAKGYVCDLAGEYLKSLGYSAGALNMLSNIRILGANVKESGGEYTEASWSVDIEHPRRTDSGRNYFAKVSGIESGAVTTSSDSYRYYNYGGKRYSHIIDPFTGKPADSGVISVSVFCEGGAEADAYATAGVLMGKEGAKEFFESKGINAVIIYSDLSFDACDVSCEVYKNQGTNNKFPVIISVIVIALAVLTVVFLTVKGKNEQKKD